MPTREERHIKQMKIKEKLPSIRKGKKILQDAEQLGTLGAT